MLKDKGFTNTSVTNSFLRRAPCTVARVTFSKHMTAMLVFGKPCSGSPAHYSAFVCWPYLSRSLVTSSRFPSLPLLVSSNHPCSSGVFPSLCWLLPMAGTCLPLTSIWLTLQIFALPPPPIALYSHNLLITYTVYCHPLLACKLQEGKILYQLKIILNFS